MLSEIGFADDDIRDNYRNTLIDKEILILWEDNFDNLEEWEIERDKGKIGRSIFRILVDKKTKEKKWEMTNIKSDTISSSEVGNFIYCPASYSITKSVIVKNDKSFNVDINFSSKKNLGLIYGKNDTIFDISEVIKDIPIEKIDYQKLKIILSSKLLHSNINEKNP